MSSPRRVMPSFIIAPRPPGLAVGRRMAATARLRARVAAMQQTPASAKNAFHPASKDATSVPRAVALSASTKNSAVPPNVPNRESFMISSLRAGGASTKRPSPQSATPSRCKPPVMRTQARQPRTPHNGAGRRNAATPVSRAASPPTMSPTTGNQIIMPRKLEGKGAEPTGSRVKKARAARSIIAGCSVRPGRAFRSEYGPPRYTRVWSGCASCFPPDGRNRGGAVVERDRGYIYMAYFMPIRPIARTSSRVKTMTVCRSRHTARKI